MAMSIEGPFKGAFDATTFARLIGMAEAADVAGSPDAAWLALEAAHVVGQPKFRPHCETHARMLGLALRQRDWVEAGGQLMRLSLVPLGHLTGRLPSGNPGRSTVSAFEPLPVRPELVDLIDRARTQ